MKNGLCIRVIVEREILSEEILTYWFSNFTLFKPKEMQLTGFMKEKLVKYDAEIFDKEFRKLHTKHIKSISLLQNNKQNISVRSGALSDSVAWLNLSIDEKTSIEAMSTLILNIERFIDKFGCIVAYVHSSFDQFMQDNTDIDFFEIYGGDTSKIHMKEHPLFKGEEVIDVEYNPGHSHICNGLWFGSAWLMWFGPKYFELIPKESIKKNKNAYSIKEYDNGVIKVQLYENIEDYSLNENRIKQKMFRDSIGLDNIAHQLLDNKNVENVEPSVEVIAEGDLRYLVSYFDENGNLTIKSKAVKSSKTLIN